uniref:E3 ubiquitin-protein ligase PPP1R11 n=1 Tax=Lynx canadensis TaxID=61383 RepID=A0A667HGF4_LYNCA
KSEAGSSETFTERTEPERQREDRSLTIKLQKQKPEKMVEWTSDTVDNKHMGRHPSKAAVIHEKPRAFGVSSMESDEEEKGCGLKGKGRKQRDRGASPTLHSYSFLPRL